MAVALSTPSSPHTFNRHIKRLIWCALIGSLALLIAVIPDSTNTAPLVGALGALLVVTAGWAVVRDVNRYVRSEAARRAEASRRSSRLGACQAAEAIQDRVANLLSVTVGYADLLSADTDVPTQSRQHAQRVLDSALAATRAVSTFRQSLGCGPSSLRGWKDIVEPSRPDPGANAPWRYDASNRVVRTRDGTVVATLRDDADWRAGTLMAHGPQLLDTLADAQHLLATLLAVPTRDVGETARVRAMLERINSAVDGVGL